MKKLCFAEFWVLFVAIMIANLLARFIGDQYFTGDQYSFAYILLIRALMGAALGVIIYYLITYLTTKNREK